MKVCFFLQRRFAYFGHAMAKLLKDKYGVNEFCGYVSLRPGYDFLNSQKDIKYSKLLLEEDVYAGYKEEEIDKDYLNYLEREYGVPNLWPYIDMDRVLRYNLLVRDYPSDKSKYSHEDMLKILQVTSKKIISFLEEEKPDFLFFSVVSNLSSMLLYYVARKMGIKTLILYCPRLGNKYIISEDYEEFKSLERIFQDLEKRIGLVEEKKRKALEFARNYLKDFQKEPTYYLDGSGAAFEFVATPVRRSDFFKFLLPTKLCRSIKWLFQSHWNYLVSLHKNDYSNIKPWVELWDKIKRKTRVVVGYRDFYDIPRVEGEDYAFFPLHSEPEAELAFRASWYMDQVWLIKQIARSLPVQYKLYVKDHPRMVGKRKRSYYREIKKIPNVKLIPPGVSSLSLISNSQLVLTIAGTAGFEGLLLKKPVIVFADLFYNILSGVRKCRSIPKLAKIIKEHLEMYEYNEEEVVNFIAAIYRESVDVDIIQLWAIKGGLSVLDQEKSKIIPLVDLIAKKLKLNLV